jgi:hypothetical protein
MNLVIIIYKQLLHCKLLQHWPRGNSHLGDDSARSSEIRRNPDYSSLQLATIISHSPVPVPARSAAARLLRLWFRIPPGHGCLSVVSVVC